jgi:transcriptional regulator with XRE-family HTH domain
VDVCLVIKQRLEELGLEQRDLAAAAEVTESYISQLLTRKKLPPAPGRTDIYDKMGKFLKLPSGKLAKLAEHQLRFAKTPPETQNAAVLGGVGVNTTIDSIQQERRGRARVERTYIHIYKGPFES